MLCTWPGVLYAFQVWNSRVKALEVLKIFKFQCVTLSLETFQTYNVLTLILLQSLLLIFDQLKQFIWIIGLNTKSICQAVWILIRQLRQKPADLDLYSLQMLQRLRFSGKGSNIPEIQLHYITDIKKGYFKGTGGNFKNSSTLFISYRPITYVLPK